MINKLWLNVKQRVYAWPLRRELIGLSVMTGLMLLMGARITAQTEQLRSSELERIRALIRAHSETSSALQGVKLLSQDRLRGDALLTVYLTVPCAVVCGERADCERVCQRQVASWDPSLHSDTKAKYLVEFTRPDGGTFGHVFRPASGQLRAIDWAKEQRILTLTHRTGVGCCESVLLYQVPEVEDAQPTHSRPLSLLATHQLHSLSAFSSMGELELGVEDQDENNQPEWLLYDERFANLTPRPFKLKLPYSLTPEGLRVNRRMIRSTPPALNERRAWIMSQLKAEGPLDGPTPEGLSSALFLELIKLCIKGFCDEADELMLLAYPQSEHAQSYWSQLKAQLAEEP